MDEEDETIALIGAHRHVQVPGGFLQLAKIVALQLHHDGRVHALVRWIDIRRDAEWVPASIISPRRESSGAPAWWKSPR